MSWSLHQHQQENEVTNQYEDEGGARQFGLDCNRKQISFVIGDIGNNHQNNFIGDTILFISF